MMCDVQTWMVSSFAVFVSMHYAKGHQESRERGHFTWFLHGFHMVFTCMEEKRENIIGVTVPSVRLGRKRLSTLSGAILAHSGSKKGVEKGSKPKPKGAQKKEDKFGHLK